MLLLKYTEVKTKMKMSKKEKIGICMGIVGIILLSIGAIYVKDKEVSITYTERNDIDGENFLRNVEDWSDVPDDKLDEELYFTISAGTDEILCRYYDYCGDPVEIIGVIKTIEEHGCPTTIYYSYDIEYDIIEENLLEFKRVAKALRDIYYWNIIESPEELYRCTYHKIEEYRNMDWVVVDYIELDCTQLEEDIRLEEEEESETHITVPLSWRYEGDEMDEYTEGTINDLEDEDIADFIKRELIRPAMKKDYMKWLRGFLDKNDRDDPIIDDHSETWNKTDRAWYVVMKSCDLRELLNIDNYIVLRGIEIEDYCRVQTLYYMDGFWIDGYEYVPIYEDFEDI